MALYHPKTGKMKLVEDEAERRETLASWAPVEPEKPAEPVKNRGGRPRKSK